MTKTELVQRLEHWEKAKAYSEKEIETLKKLLSEFVEENTTEPEPTKNYKQSETYTWGVELIK